MEVSRSTQPNIKFLRKVRDLAVKKNIVLKCVSAFLTTNFNGGRHLRRVKKI